ncbi:TPA: hypothetical protein ACYY05_002602 [Staphylococcus aureus]
MNTINDFLKTYIPEDYNGFSADKFLNGKKLKIENVKKERVQGQLAIKIDVRIVEDANGDNDNKVFTIRLDKNEHVSKETFKEYLENARGHIGYQISIDAHTDIEQAYFYQQRMLTLVVTHFEIIEDVKQLDVIQPSMKDRPLRNLADYRVFDIEGFFDENELFFKGTYFDKGNVYFNIQIEDEALIKFAVPVENADILPASLLTINGESDDLLEDYKFSNASSHRYGTRWTFYFDEITFKKGIVTEQPFKLEYDSSYNMEMDKKDDEISKEQNQKTNSENNNPFDSSRSSMKGRMHI